MFEVLVTYPAEFHPDLDANLFRAFGPSETSSLGYGVSEHIWTYELKEDAEKVVATIKREFTQCEADMNF